MRDPRALDHVIWEKMGMKKWKVRLWEWLDVEECFVKSVSGQLLGRCEFVKLHLPSLNSVRQESTYLNATLSNHDRYR